MISEVYFTVARGAEKRLATPNDVYTTLAKDEIIYQWRNSSLYRHLSSPKSDGLQNSVKIVMLIMLKRGTPKWALLDS